MTNRELAQYISIIRFQTRLNVTEIAEKAGVGRSRLSNIINDDKEYELEEKASSVLTKMKLAFPSAFEYKQMKSRAVNDSVQTKKNNSSEAAVEKATDLVDHVKSPSHDLILRILENQQNATHVITELLKTQNKILERQEKDVVSKLSTIESSLADQGLFLDSMQATILSRSEEVLKNLADIQGLKDRRSLIGKADNKAGDVLGIKKRKGSNGGPGK